MSTLLARLLLIISVALVPALGLQAYTESEARRTRLQLVEDEALRLVRLVSAEQQRIIEGAGQALDVLSSASSVQDNLPERCIRLLANLIQQSPRYNSVSVIGLDGHIRCAPFPTDPGIDLSDRAYFRRALQTGGTVVGDYAIGRHSKTPRIHVARPFRNRDGVIAGVVEVAIDLDWLQQQLDRLPLPPAATAMIADRNGTILARRPDPASLVGKPILDTNRFMLNGNEIAVATIKARAGNTIFVAYSPPGAAPKGLLVKVSLDRDITFAAMTQANRAGLMLIVAGGVLALLVTTLLGRQLIRRPLNRLLAVADRWRSGDLAARSGLRTDRGEFGRLAAAFDAMAAALEAREHALHTALESTTDSVIVIDRTWRITYLSERAKAHVAQGRDLVGQILWDAFPGTSDSVFAAGYRAAMERGVPVHTVGYSAAFKTWFEAHAYPSVDGVTAFFRDVTEERRVAAALRESDELFRVTFEQAAVGMAVVGLDGAWLRVNDRLCAITGYTREELLAAGFLDITHPDELEASRARLSALRNGAIETCACEKRYLRKDGGFAWVKLTAAPLRDHNGKPERFIAVIDDIAERKRFEAALHESEQQFRAIFEQSAMGMAVIGPDGSWQRVNDKLCAITGYGRDELLAGRFQDISHPDNRTADLAQLEALLASNGMGALERRFLRKDGRIGWAKVTASLLHDRGGRPERIIAAIDDITERKFVEAALRESEELFRAAFEQMTVGMAILGLDGTWLRVNDKLCALTGYTRDEMLDRTALEITHPDDVEATQARVTAMLTGEVTPQKFEKRYLRKDGNIVWVTVTGALLRDPEGRPERFMAIIEDITERKRVEAALQESEGRLALAREAAGFGIWEWDVVTGAVTWSEEQWRLHGYDGPRPGQPDHATWLDRVHPEDRERVLGELEAVLADPGGTIDTEYRVLRSDGGVGWLLARAKVARDADGRPVSIVGMNMDVTASRATEAALRRLTDELEARVRQEVAAREAAQARAAHAERLQALGQLAGGVAHDFNNVLQAIAGAAALIERRPDDEAGVRRLARMAIAATERGASVTGRLLAFGHRADLRAEPLDTTTLLNDLCEMLARTLGAGLEIHVRAGADLPPVLADKGQLETVLVNLATNARDAMPSGGQVILAAAVETVPADGAPHPAGLAPGRYVRFSVTDDGVGMDAATLARASEPFFTTKQRGAGTGLGLSMAKGFAEQSGGALLIESSRGKGTTATLWLPEAWIDRRPGDVDAAASRPGTATRCGRVLVVDGEDLVREVVAECLEDAGFETLVATNGTEALALLAAGEEVDILVTDLSMPYMDGLAVIRAAHELRPGLPAVLLTGYAREDSALAGGDLVSGSFSLLRKPVSGAHLIERLRALLAERTRAGGDRS